MYKVLARKENHRKLWKQRLGFFFCRITHVIYIKKVFEIPTRYHTFTYLLIQATNMSEKQYNFDL